MRGVPRSLSVLQALSSSSLTSLLSPSPIPAPGFRWSLSPRQGLLCCLSSPVISAQLRFMDLTSRIFL